MVRARAGALVLDAACWLWLMTSPGAAAAPDAGDQRASITGGVLGPEGAPLSRARVTAAGGPRGDRRRTTSDSEGRFHLDVEPGRWALAVELEGFLIHRQADLAVAAGDRVELAITLETVVLDALRELDVKSASKVMELQRQAPSVVGVVTREQATLYGWTSLNDVLYRQPGFAPAQDYDRRTVGARGLFEGWNNNHLLHLVDGVPWNDNLYGTAYTWEVTPLSMAKSIEVLRGPGSALYGSYAANGVIAVNTVSAADLAGGVVAEVRAGNAGTRAYELLAGFGARRAVSAVLGYSAYETDGNEYPSYDGSARRDDGGQLARFTTRDGRSSHYFWAKLEAGAEVEGTKADGLSLQYHEQYWDYDTGHGWLWWIPDFRESMAETRRLASLAYRPAPAARLTQEYVVRFQRHAIDWSTRYYPNGAFDGFYPAGMWEDLDTHADDVFARAQLSFDLDDRADLLLGVEAAQLSARRRAGIPLGLTLGARWDHQSFDFDAIGEPGRPTRDRTFDRVSPRLAVVLEPRSRRWSRCCPSRSTIGRRRVA